MIQMDKLMVWGAWTLMAAVGSLTVWKISKAPKVDPVFAVIENDLNRNPRIPRMAPPPPLPKGENVDIVIRPARPAPDLAYVIWPIMIGEPVEHRPMTVLVLPFAVVGEAKADLDGTTVTWTLQNPPMEKLAAWMTQKTNKPAGFVIERQCEDGPVETVGKVGPEVRSFTDLSTEPRLAYRYWVSVMGEETIRTAYPEVRQTVTKGLNGSAEARTPSITRVKLVGGEKTKAILRVETYDKAQKKWIAKTVMAAPGREIGASGWTLKGLRFDNFTLVADLTDDDGVEQVRSTKD